MTVPLADALSVLTPARETTQLLRACLGHGEVRPESWLGAPGQTREANHARHVLAPLLYHSLQRAGRRPGEPLGAYLRAAVLAEEVRRSEYERISAAALWRLGEASVTPIVVGGAALAETVYPHPAVRHSDSIALVVRARDLPEAVRHLQHEDFTLEPDSRRGAPLLRHRSGLRLSLRCALLASSGFGALTDEIWLRSVAAQVTGAPARRLSSADALLQVCVDGLLGGVAGAAQWAADAWHLIARSPDLDWDILVAAVRQAGAELPLAVALQYLARTLHTRVPAETWDGLSMGATRTTGATRDVCLYATRLPPVVPVRRLLLACRSWRSRALVLKWLLCPAPGALRLHDRSAQGRPLAAAYAARIWRIGLSRARRAALRP